MGISIVNYKNADHSKGNPEEPSKNIRLFGNT